MTAAAPDIAAQSPIKLKAAHLPQLVPGPSGTVTGPSYPRRRDRAGIVHLGVGGFHRAHMGVYVDRLLALTNGESDAICGVGLLPSDATMMAALAGQDHLYTVLERGPEGEKAHVVGAMVDYLHAPSDPEAVLARLASPQTHLVSMTITESGYMVNEATGELDLSQPNVQHDLSSPRVPKSVYGYLCQALARRRQAGLSPFTVLSCDNVQKNGDLTRRMLLAFAREVDPALADWIGAHGAFPNSMVDRITPRTTPEDCALLQARFGIDDAWPVVTEPYSQWVLEDRFVDGRPAWDQVGVQMVQDVEHYELMKLRLLNGGHSALAYLGWLAGYRQVHEVVADPQFRRFLIDLMRLEVQPLLPAIPGIDIDLYCETLLHRFSNANMADQVARLCCRNLFCPRCRSSCSAVAPCVDLRYASRPGCAT